MLKVVEISHIMMLRNVKIHQHLSRYIHLGASTSNII